MSARVHFMQCSHPRSLTNAHTFHNCFSYQNTTPPPSPHLLVEPPGTVLNEVSTMTDTRTADRKELEEALMASGADQEQAGKIAEALEKERGVKSWKSFYVYFKKFDLKVFFDEQLARAKDAEIFVALDQAWDVYSAKIKAEEVAKQELRDAAETKPIDPETNESLTKTWKDRYAYTLHPV